LLLRNQKSPPSHPKPFLPLIRPHPCCSRGEPHRYRGLLHTGKIILARQQEAGWGAKVIERLAADLQAEFPDMSGLTRRNLVSMRAFAGAFPDGSMVKRLVSPLPRGQFIRLIQMVKDPTVREFYIRETPARDWSRDILEIQIRNQLHLRAAQAQNHFALTMPPTDPDMAARLFKDPYLFDFLGTAHPRREAEVERALVDHIQKLLLELGAGFAFVGRQVPLEVGGEDYPLDLLFYHLKLRRCVVIELKARAFTPGDATSTWRVVAKQVGATTTGIHRMAGRLRARCACPALKPILPGPGVVSDF